jgi:glucokinase
MMDARHVDPKRCHVAAVVHGEVDTTTGLVTADGMGWHGVPLAKLLADRIGTSVTVHDVARAAAVAEHREGAARGARRVVVFNIGPEFTASLIVDGALDTGVSGRAGMLGRCPVPTPAGVMALDDHIGSVVAKRRYQELSGRQVDWMADVHGLARDGDPHALAVLADQADALAFVSGWLINVTDPELLVLTGSIGEYDEATKARLVAAIVDHADQRVLRHCEIRITTMGRQAWIRGGVHSALEHQRAVERSAV